MNDHSTMVGRSYHATDIAQQRAVYDDWAEQYERDLCAMGNRIPGQCAALFAHYVPREVAPILDAGCGTGQQSHPLALLGYGPFVGIDLSQGMLDMAERKGVYQSLHRMTLGEPLDFPDDHFPAIMCCGVLTPGHAPASSLFELIRIAKPGAPIVFSIRDDAQQEPQYPNTVAELDASGVWRREFCTAPFQSMPFGEPEVYHRAFLYYKNG